MYLSMLKSKTHFYKEMETDITLNETIGTFGRDCFHTVAGLAKENATLSFFNVQAAMLHL